MIRPASFVASTGLLLVLAVALGTVACSSGDGRPGVVDSGGGRDIVTVTDYGTPPEDIPVVPDIPDVPEPDVVEPPAIAFDTPVEGSTIDLDTLISLALNTGGEVEKIGVYVEGTYPDHYDRGGNWVQGETDWILLEYLDSEDRDDDGFYVFSLTNHASKLDQYDVGDGAILLKAQLRLVGQVADEWEEVETSFVLDRSGVVQIVGPEEETIIDLETPIQVEVREIEVLEEGVLVGTFEELFFFVWGTYAAHVDGDGNWVDERQDWVRLDIKTAADMEEGGLFTFALADYEEKLERYRVGGGTCTVKAQARYKGQESGEYPEDSADFRLDRSGPDITLLNHCNIAEVLDAVGTMRLHFKVEDPASVATIELDIGGSYDRTIPVVSSGEYWVSLDLSDTPDATQFTLKTSDGLGNESMLTRGMRIIPAPPYRLGHPFDLGGDQAILSLAVGDYDDDDYPDLWVSTSVGLWLLLGDAYGGFRDGYLVIPGTDGMARAIYIVDLDDDGTEDLLLLSQGGTMTIRGAFRIPSGRATVLDTYEVYDGQTFDNVGVVSTMADFDDDGLLDLAVGLESEEDSLVTLARVPFEGFPAIEEEEPAEGGADSGATSDDTPSAGEAEMRFFADPVVLRGVAGISDLAVGDFDGDGALDLVTGRTAARQVSCYPGRGDGRFLDAIDTFVADSDGGPVTVQPARFPDGDAYLDLVVGVSGVDSLVMLPGNGDGTFDTGAASWERVGGTPTELVPSYFEPYGEETERTHLLVLVPNNSTVRFYIQQSALPEFESAYATGAAPKNLRAEDMNADGILDLVYYNEGTGRLVVGLGLSADSDLPREILVHLPGDDDKLGLGIQPVDFAAGEIVTTDTIATDDLVIVAAPTATPPDLVVHAPRPDQDFGVDPPVVESAQLSPIVVFGAGPSGPRNNRPLVSWIPPPFNAVPVSIALGPIDGVDGLDVAVATTERPGQTVEVVLDPEAEEPTTELVLIPTVALLQGNREGRFVPYVEVLGTEMWVKPYYEAIGFTPLPPGVDLPVTEATEAEGAQSVSVMLGTNLDSYLYMDLVILSPHVEDGPEAATSVWLGEGGAVASFQGPIGDLWRYTGREPTHAALAEVSEVPDAYPDLIVSNSDDQNISVLEGVLGQPPFKEAKHYATPAEPRGAAGADLDADGRNDIVVAVAGNVVIAWAKVPGIGGPSSFEDMVFLRPEETYDGTDPNYVLVDDINFDGTLDLIVTNTGSDGTSFFFGGGQRAFPNEMDAPTGKGPTKLMRADFNGDACDDYAVLNPSGKSVTIYLSIPDDCP